MAIQPLDLALAVSRFDKLKVPSMSKDLSNGWMDCFLRRPAGYGGQVVARCADFSQ